MGRPELLQMFSWYHEHASMKKAEITPSETRTRRSNAVQRVESFWVSSAFVLLRISSCYTFLIVSTPEHTQRGDRGENQLILYRLDRESYSVGLKFKSAV